MILQHTVKTGISLVTEVELLTYTYTATNVLQVIARAVLGDVSKPIAGNGIYSLRFYVNNILITPMSEDGVPSGITQTMVVSRAVPIVTGDVVSIRVLGRSADTSVNTSTDLYDSTSITVADVTGAGTTIVDHDYGGADALSYKTCTGAGIGGAIITAYLKSDYDAGRRSAAFIIGRSRTIGNGTWAHGLALSTGTYTIVFYQGLFGPDETTVIVP